MGTIDLFHFARHLSQFFFDEVDDDWFHVQTEIGWITTGGWLRDVLVYNQ